VATVSKVVTRIGWHELVAADVERAEVFYAELFHWTLRVWRPGVHDYAMIHSAGSDHGGFLRQDDVPHWLAYVEVPDADAVAARAEELGGRIAGGPVELPGVGRYVVVADPQGAEIAAIAVEEQGAPPAGVFVWDELLTEDPAAAREFYGRLFGWTVAAASASYSYFRATGARIAGLQRKTPESPCSCWLSYLHADDVAAAVERAERLGAVATLPPTEVAGIGGVAVLIDPVGAPFGLLQPTS
jgi:predicted enzyme related to lactoylglutathione lyase